MPVSQCCRVKKGTYATVCVTVFILCSTVLLYIRTPSEYVDETLRETFLPPVRVGGCHLPAARKGTVRTSAAQGRTVASQGRTCAAPEQHGDDAMEWCERQRMRLRMRPRPMMSAQASSLNRRALCPFACSCRARTLTRFRCFRTHHTTSACAFRAIWHGLRQQSGWVRASANVALAPHDGCAHNAAVGRQLFVDDFAIASVTDDIRRTYHQVRLQCLLYGYAHTHTPVTLGAGRVRGACVVGWARSRARPVQWWVILGLNRQKSAVITYQHSRAPW